MIAGGLCVWLVLGLCSDDGCAVGDKAGDGPIGVGEAVEAVGPALEMFPAFVVGEGVFDGDPFRRVVVPLAFPKFVEGRYCPWGDGGTVHLVQHGQHRVREVVAQTDERGNQSVHEHQLMAGSGAGRPLSGSTSYLVSAALDPDHPWPRQLRYQGRQMNCRNAREQHMRQQ